MNVKNFMLSGKKPGTQGHFWSGSVRMKYPEEANPQRQKVNVWLPGAGEGARE